MATQRNVPPAPRTEPRASTETARQPYFTGETGCRSTLAMESRSGTTS